MSTNFYLCAGPEVTEHALHVGKRSFMGYSFQGHRWAEPDEQIRSWADWRRLIRRVGFVVDEYNVAMDAAAFVREVEMMNETQRQRQYLWMASHAQDPLIAAMLEDCWLDEENYSFTWREFS